MDRQDILCRWEGEDNRIYQDFAKLISGNELTDCVLHEALVNEEILLANRCKLKARMTMNTEKKNTSALSPESSASSLSNNMDQQRMKLRMKNYFTTLFEKYATLPVHSE